MNKKFIEKEVDLNDVHFWLDNPRVPFDPSFGEQEIINHYIKYEKLESLKKSIKKEGLLEGEFLCFKDDASKKLITYDGNRRLAAIKSLVNDGYRWNQNLKIKEYYKESDIFKAVLIKHGTSDGASRRGWQPLQRDKFNHRSGNKISYPKAFEIILKNKKKITDYKLKQYIEYTTLERILGYECVKKALKTISIENHLDVMIELAKKKISVSSVKSTQDFKENFYDAFIIIVNNYALKESIVQTNLDIDLKDGVTSGTDSKKSGIINDINETQNEEETESLIEKSNTNKVEEKTIANSKCQQVYRFFEYKNMGRPSLEKSSLSIFLEQLSNMNITTRNIESQLPIGTYFRPILEAHIELLKVELKNSNYNFKMLGEQGKIDTYNNLIANTSNKSLCTVDNLNIIIHVAKSLNILKKKDVDASIIDRTLLKIHEFNHGKRFIVNQSELITYDKFIKQYIGIIYKIILRVRKIK